MQKTDLRGGGRNTSIKIRAISNEGEITGPDPSIQWYLMGPLQYCRVSSLYKLPSKFNPECIFFPLKTKRTKSIYFIQLHFIPDIDEGETEILQIALHSKLGSSGEKLLNTWLSLFLFSKIIKIVFNLKYFAEYSVLLNQGFHKCKLFNSTNCKPPDFFRLIWTESELKAFQVLPITIS